MKKIFKEDIYGDANAIGNYLELTADDYFVNVITDCYEGHAMFDVSTAEKLLDALPRAIAHVKSCRRALITAE